MVQFCYLKLICFGRLKRLPVVCCQGWKAEGHRLKPQSVEKVRPTFSSINAQGLQKLPKNYYHGYCSLMICLIFSS